MDLFGWIGFCLACSALGTAGSAMAQVVALKKEVEKLKEELRR
jgi:hypothetical protein